MPGVPLKARGVLAVAHALAAGLHAHKPDFRIVEEARKHADGVGAAAHARHGVVGKPPNLLNALGAGLAADYGLEMTHHDGVGMRANGGTEHIEHARIIDEAVERLVHGLLEGALTAQGRTHFGAHHAHAEHVEGLPMHVLLAHVHDALHAEERGRGGRGHAVLTGAGFRHQTFFAHALGEQHLTEGVVDLVRAEMVQVFALQIDLRAAEFAAQIAAVEDGRRTPAVVGEQIGQLSLEFGIVAIFNEGVVDFVQHLFEGLGNELTAVGAEETGFKSLGTSLAGFGNAHDLLLLSRSTAFPLPV